MLPTLIAKIIFILINLICANKIRNCIALLLIFISLKYK